MLKFTHTTNNIIKVIGVGGGGNNAVDNMYLEGIKDVDFIISNTDAQALKKSPVPKKIALGNTGLGAGNKPSVGREAALQSIDEIRGLLEKDTKMVFITAGMGGGTGTGAAPVIASVAKELGILTIGIVTIPFSFEGKRRKLQAQQGIDELKKHVDTILIIVNDKLRDIHPDMKLKDAFAQADNILTTAAKGIAELITVTGIINVDFEDVKTVMENGGKSIMSSATAEGEDRAIECSEKVLNSPLLSDSNIEGAENILLFITSGTDEMSLNEVTDIADYIKEKSGENSEVIWGTGIDESLGNKIKITLVATGFESIQNQKKIKQATAAKKKIKHTLYGDNNKFTPLEDTTKPEEESIFTFGHSSRIQDKEEPNDISSQNDTNISESSSLVDTEDISQTEKIVYDFETGEKIQNTTETQDYHNDISEISNEKDIYDIQDDYKNSISQDTEAAALNQTNIMSEKTSHTSISNQNIEEEKEKNNTLNDLSKEDKTVDTSKQKTSSFTFTKKTSHTKAKAPSMDTALLENSKKKAASRVQQLRQFSSTPLSKKKINELENIPAYKRNNTKFVETPESDQNFDNNNFQVSINKDNETVIKKNNSYIHKNVD